MAVPVVELDPVQHVYRRLDTGRATRSVSSILRRTGVRQPPPDLPGERGEAMERGLARGTQVHRLTRSMDETGDLEDAFEDYFDPAALLPETVNYVSAYDKFLTESGYQPIAWEVVLYHPTLDYAGRADGVGWYRRKRTMIDRKTDRTLHRAVWLQLAFYRLAWCAMFPAEPIEQTYAVQLCDNMDYRLIRNPLEPGDEPFVHAALWMDRWHSMKL